MSQLSKKCVKIKTDMKHLRFLFLIPVLCFTSCNKNATYEPKQLDPNVTYSNIYLLMGQSNASGVSPQSYLQDSNPDIYQKYIQGNPDVLISYDTDNRIETNYVPTKFGFGNTEEFFGPEIGMAEVLANPSETTYIIKATFSGSCLQTQYVNSSGKKLELYKRFIKFIKKQLNALESQGINPRVRGVFWMQGESDTFLDDSSKYREAEQYFLEYLRIDLNNWIYEYFNFVDAYIFTNGVCWVYPEIVNDCKQRLADENDHCYCIKTNGEDEDAITLHIKSETGEGDDLAHYDSKSMLLLGQTAGTFLLK